MKDSPKAPLSRDGDIDDHWTHISTMPFSFEEHCKPCAEDRGMVSHVTCWSLVGILDFTVLCHIGMVLHLVHLAIEN